MSSEVTVNRLQFTLTVTFHYLFPILTMGLALFIAYFATVAYRGRQERRATAEQALGFWTKIFAINFAFGVVTGIPLEFQFGTNWAQFSSFAGGVIGQTLAMEGTFAFFLESVFLGVLLFGANRLGRRARWLAALAVFAGSWLSGWFIIATNAWMQHPVGYTRDAAGNVQLSSFGELFTNPWLPWQYLHNMGGAALTGAFVLAALGAFYLLADRHHEFARTCLRVGVVAALVFCILQIFPTGDRHAHQVYKHQPAAFAAMEGRFETSSEAPLTIIGNPDTRARELDSALELPGALSFLTTGNWTGRVTGLNDIPEDEWPDSVPLVYYAYHIMVGLGTILLVVAGLAAFLLWRGRLFDSRPVLWTLMLAFPFAYIANIAGWTVAETGRQPWVVYGLLRTADGISPPESVPAGTGLFTLLGFAGLYALLALLFVVLVIRIVHRGPAERSVAEARVAA
jgi:cytochrome d ubiquinol oxidase subunit I